MSNAKECEIVSAGAVFSAPGASPVTYSHIGSAGSSRTNFSPREHSNLRTQCPKLVRDGSDLDVPIPLEMSRP